MDSFAVLCTFLQFSVPLYSKIEIVVKVFEIPFCQ